MEHVDGDDVGEQRRAVGQEMEGEAAEPDHEDKRDEQKWSALRISFGRRNNSRSATSAASKRLALLAALNGSAKSASLLPRSQ